MRRLTKLYASTVGKKVIMAVTGVILVLFLVAHMLGNLKAFQGAESFNVYAEGIRGVGHPFLPHEGALWVLRVVLLAAVGLHVWAAYQLYRSSRKARSVGYRKDESQVFTRASRTMRWGGLVILAFVVYHILHFTTGQAHLDFVEGDPFHNLVSAFQHPLVATVYVVAMVPLALHLYHGIWSTFQTLGWNHPKYNHYRRPAATILTVLLFAGFVLVPVAVLAGWVS